MLIKLPITQIPHYWELIKTAILNIDAVPSTDAAAYSRGVLIKLLSAEYICIIMHKENIIQAISIIEFKLHMNTKKKILQIHGVYGLQKVSDEEWADAFEQIRQFAIKESCDKLYGFTNNKRVEEILEAAGYYGDARYFIRQL